MKIERKKPKLHNIAFHLSCYRISMRWPQYLHVFLHGFLENTLNAWMPTSPYSAVSLSESLGTLKFKLHLCLSSSQQQQQ